MGPRPSALPDLRVPQWPEGQLHDTALPLGWR